MTGENNTFRTFRVGPWSVINALQFRKMFTCWRNKNKISRGLEPRPSHRRVSRPDSDCGRIRRIKIHLSVIHNIYSRRILALSLKWSACAQRSSLTGHYKDLLKILYSHKVSRQLLVRALNMERALV